MTMRTSQNSVQPIMTTLRSFVEAFNRHDALACAAIYAEDGVSTSSEGARYEGRQQIEAYFRGLFTAFPDARFEVLTAANPSANQHVVEYTLEGTFLGPMNLGGREVAPTGFRFKNQYVAHVTTNNGFITALTSDGDPALMLRQLRVMPAPFLSSEERIEKVRRAISAMNEGDVAAITECFTENATYGSEVFGRVQGREAIGRTFANTLKAYPNAKLTIKEIVCDDVLVVAQVQLQAVNSGDFTWREGTGKAVDANMTLVCDVGPAGIVGCRQYLNSTAIARQLGFLE